MASDPRLDDDTRALFGRIADLLIPHYKHYPSATEAGVAGGTLDAVLEARPDLAEAFFRGLDLVRASDLSRDVNALYRTDEDAFNALSLVASGGYYMTDAARQAVGYPGQESLTYDAHATPDYLTDGLLERVVRRGPTYRDAPRD